VSEKTNITTLFLDIGGVLLTNGWDRHARERAAEYFELDLDEMNERHHLTFDTYEEGKLELEEYLARVVFFRERSFSPEEFREFMFAQSKPFQDTIDFFHGLKSNLGLRMVAVSNEGRELTEHRIRQFNLRALFDAFISSCYVHYRKPDKDMYRMALNVSQAEVSETVYVDDRAMFVEVAGSLGMHGVHHVDLETTRSRFAEIGLPLAVDTANPQETKRRGRGQ
jgi:putative hydrolase of the HAD superfamily